MRKWQPFLLADNGTILAEIEFQEHEADAGLPWPWLATIFGLYRRYRDFESFKEAKEWVERELWADTAR